MKKLLLSIIFISSAFLSLSQSPEKMSYQSVVRDENNALLVNQPIGMRVSILQGEIEGTSVYSETHSVNTNANGLASLEIGGGTVLSGVFADIDWASDPYFILTEVDIDGGTNYTITSTSQLMSVPYALYAKNAGSSTPGPQGEQGPPGPGLSDGTMVNQMLYWNGSDWTQLNPGNNGQVLTLCDGQLIWTNGQCPGVVQSLNCSGINVLGVLEQNIFTESVIISIPYNGGNGEHYDAATFTSSGVEGFSAQLTEGDFNTGDGVIYLQVYGATEGIGTATFEINLGGQSCTVNVQVNPILAGPTGVPTVGSYYQGGRIAYIFQPNDGSNSAFGAGYVPGEVHGIIVANNNIGLYPWGCDGYSWSNDQTGLGWGLYNTTGYLNWGCNEPWTANPATLELNMNGYTDWVLPSSGELSLILGSYWLSTIPSYQYYWSSTDSFTNAYEAIAVMRVPANNNVTSLQGSFSSSLEFLVLPIRYF